MKKATKILAGAALIVSLSTLSGCVKEDIIDNPPYALYGPPITPEQETETPAPPIYGPPAFTPEEEAIETPTPTPTLQPEEETFVPAPDPATEPVEEVYGPPPDDMDPQDNW